jgi:hypothetical protein
MGNTTRALVQSDLERLEYLMPVLQNESEFLQHELESKKTIINEFQKYLIDLKQRKENILHRVREGANSTYTIDVPYLGKVPIRQDELVSLFPLILAIVFFVYCSLLQNLIRLRRAYHHLSLKKILLKVY